jgi:gas vesicle protein
MANFIDPKPQALGIAGGAIAGALLDLLVARKLISSAEARTVCRNAQDEITRLIGMNGADASAIIDGVIGRLP